MKDFFDANERIPDVKTGVQLTSSAYTALCYTIMSQESWFNAIKQGAAIYLSFGAFAGIYLFKVCLYFYDLITAHNKNLTKVGAFFRELLTTVIFVMAIVFGLFTNTVVGGLSPIFFLLSSAVGVVYHLSVFIYAGIRVHFLKDESKKEIYKASCIKHFISCALFSIGAGLLSCFMLTSIAPFAFGIANAVFNACCFILIAGLTLKAKFSKKVISKKEDEDKEQKIESQSLIQPIQNDYYTCQNRATQISEVEDPQRYLLAEIQKKIQTLQMQIQNSTDIFFSERKKRDAKISALQQLKRLISNPFAKREDLDTLLKQPIFHSCFNNPFQSFFRKNSDTLDVFLAARSYFNHLPETLTFQV
ncbi:MAG TPA: hypothetical protein VHM20_08030 [Gammaproteobacteria bacterium]|nr:hypothetical protein [Gammaproteobacteria bacterium]